MHSNVIRGKTTAQRFWEKVRKDEGCWEWTACKDKDGYGFFRLDGKNLKAHRFALALEGKNIEEGKFVCHSCDNPSCVNPAHLWIGDNRENQIDASNKGRHAHQKLSRVDVLSIRKRRTEGEKAISLAREYGIAASYVTNLMRNRKWAHANQ